MMSLINWFFTWGIKLAKATWLKMTENQFILTALEETKCMCSLLSIRLLMADTETHRKSIPERHRSLCLWTLHPGGWSKRIISVSLDLAYVLKPCFKRPKSDRTKVFAGDFCEFVICYTPRDNWSTIAADKIGSSLYFIASLHQSLLG